MNLQLVASIVVVCTYLLCLFFLVHSLAQIVYKGILALQTSKCAELEQSVKPIPYSALFWLVLIWGLVGISVLSSRSYSLLDAPIETISLAMLSGGVVIVVFLAFRIITHLNRYGVYDFSFWSFLAIRLSAALLVVGAVVLGLTLYSGTSYLNTSVLYWNSSTLVSVLQLLGLMVIICFAGLGLISNGWIKTVLGLDLTRFHVQITSAKNNQSEPLHQVEKVDLETEFFFHIRNLRHENDT